MNLKQAINKGMKEQLFRQCRIQFDYDRGTGKIQKVVSSPALMNFNYITGMKEDEQKEWVRSMQDPIYAEKFKKTFVGVETVLTDTTFVADDNRRMIKIDGVLAPVSHFVWFLETGTVPESLAHLDGDQDNTVFSNLKPSEKGASVKIVKKKFPCRITVGDQLHYLGTFSSAEERDEARDRYCIEKGITKLKPGRPAGSTMKPEDRKPVKPYQAVVLYEGRQYNLGRFDTRDEVKAARDAFRQKRAMGAGGTSEPKQVTPEVHEWMR